MDNEAFVGVFAIVSLVIVLLFLVKSRSTQSATGAEAQSQDSVSTTPVPAGPIRVACSYCGSEEIGVTDDSKPLDQAIAKCLTCGRELGPFIELKYERVPERRHFFKQVHGIFYKNSDGSSRQKTIKSCSVGEVLELIPEPDNPRDSDAIKVCRKNGDQLGYLPEGHRMSQDGDLTDDYYATVEEVYPLDDKPGSCGCKIRIGVLERPKR
ncbi:MAG TPA: HIRAN domain-containing protein [Candidatus Angelobacter sp.]|jgi:hypothetical protein